MEALAAIEKLIKRRIERVLVPGFQPNTGSVATFMGGDARRPAREERRPAREERRPAEAPRRDAKRGGPPADPIFSKPYEPGLAPAAEPAPAAKQEAPRGKRKQPQVAALLGGLKRA
jgi:hypothetical protein